MKKTDKKIDNSVREVLTEVCDIALKEVPGFQWITHFSNYGNFPESLSVVCIFDTDNDLSSVLSSKQDEDLRKLIQEKLGTVDIHIKNIEQHVTFDTEEACRNENGGKWHERFKGHKPGKLLH
ncbi:MAG: hypothetical protein ACI9JM_002709 [Halioglobus sp.]|jgi:hypothetical protein